MTDENPEMLNWTQNRLNAALANGDGITLRVSYDMDADEWIAAIVEPNGDYVTCESNWDTNLASRSPRFERALELLELVCKADATFEGKAGEFDRHLALVLNKLEG